MNVRPTIFALAVTVGLGLAATPALIAAPTPTLDNPPAAAATPPIQLLPPASPTFGATRQREISGNPLWAIPLSTLSATRERPLFLPTRRPPAPVVAAPRVEVAKRPAPSAAEPERPALAFVGAVVGTTEAIALFLDQSTNDVVRLRTGQIHDGWVLHSVKGREAVLLKDKRTAVFTLPAPGDGMPVAAAQAPVTAPGAAPFVPRSTPKNGEPDGL